MTHLKSRIVLLLLLASFTTFSQRSSDLLRLWYNKPASDWNQALPIGNGALAAMIFGDVTNERLQLNEETIWAGEPGNNVPKGVFDSIQQIRKLLFEGKYKEAQDLSNRTFPRNAPPGLNYGMPYQTAGDLRIHFPDAGPVSDYQRDLDIGNAVAGVAYTANGVRYRREYIASLKDRIIAIRLTADKPGSISFSLGVETPYKEYKVQTKDGKLLLSGHTSTVDNKAGKVRYQVQVQPIAEGGRMTCSGTGISVEKADRVTICISIATNHVSYDDISGNEEAKAGAHLKAATRKKYEAIRKDHIAEYRKYFDRVSLDLGVTDAVKKPTNIRIAEFGKGNDPALASLYFQFGRYLLISSSMPGTQPANLQGKWNDKLSPPWDSKYTVNINTEMNYWPAEVTALPEMHEPLFAMLKDLSVTGKESAAGIYHARGWNIHHNTDLWRISGVVDGGFYGMWPMGGAWLTQHIWQHYLFTGDKAFLKEYYPVLKGAALFYADVLQEEPTHQWLVVSPSMSPENTYRSGVGVTAGATMDNQLVFDVFSNVIRSSEILGTDKAFADTLRDMVRRLPPMQIGQHGQLQEWLHDWDNKNSKHRHVSHLYGLYPAAQISPFRDPGLFEAARNSLVYRGDRSTGWSMGWKVNLWARLLDGNRAYKLIADQLTPAEEGKGESGGTYPNLFDAHPPFQIDGNFGCTSGIAEMLLQSHDGNIHLLPALPGNWSHGSVKGLVARGGFVIDMSWDKGKITSLKILSKRGGNCRIRVHGELTPPPGVVWNPASGENPNPFYVVPTIKTPLKSPEALLSGIQTEEGRLLDFDTKAGRTYVFTGK